jgi:hypothetical protein
MPPARPLLSVSPLRVERSHVIIPGPTWQVNLPVGPNALRKSACPIVYDLWIFKI